MSKEKKIVYTYGVFDLLHPGHVVLLERSKALGDYLIVGVVSDEPVKKLKGNDRPVMPQKDRMFLVNALGCVDKVIPQSDYDPSGVLKSLHETEFKVNILTKGDDWDYIPGTETIELLGGVLIKLPYSEAYSTSNLVKQIRNNNDTNK